MIPARSPAQWLWQSDGEGRPLRGTVLALTLLPLLLTLIALGVTITRVAHETIEHSEGEKLAAQARTVAEMVDAAVGHRLQDLQSRAALLATLNLHQQPVILSRWLDTIQQHIPEYTWIGFADNSGVIVAAGRDMLIGQNVAQREWFSRGREQPSTIDVHEAMMLNTALGPHPQGGPWRFIDLATPVRSHTGLTIGVLAAHLSWDWLLAQHRRLIESIPKHLDAEIVVLGQDGATRLTRPQLETVPLDHLRSFQLAKTSQRGWLRERWTDGQEYLVGYTRNPGAGEHHQLGWVTLIRLPLQAVNSQIWSVIMGIWVLVIASVLLFVAAMAFLLSLALKTTEHLVKDIERVTRDGGRLDAQRPAPREFRVLAQATNQMILSMEAQQAADQDKSRFIADISHEIRTPLGGMIGLAELLRQRLHSGQDQRDIEALIRCGKDLNQLLSDVIDFSAIGENRLRLEPRPIQPAQWIEHQVELFYGLAQSKQISLRLVQSVPRDLWLAADPLKLGQVMKNLLSNAIKFTDQGWVEVRARWLASANGTPASSTLLIEVEDTGIGLTQAQQEIIFGRFQQAKGSISERYGGSGLGLTLARGLVEAMGGQLRLRSKEHEGTRIEITLPLPIASAPALQSALPTDTAPIAPQTRTVLIVDDIAINREILKRWLEHHGHLAIEAETGKAAVHHCQVQHFDLILLDIDLPDISGREVARRVRKSSGPSANSPMIAISGHAFDQDISDSLAAGIDLHISKPVDFELLPELIQAVLTDRAARAGRKTAAS